MNPKVDTYISKANKWQSEMTAIRELLLSCGLTEDIKWRVPCYSFNNGNVALIAAFKDYVALSFIKGELLADADKVLVSPGENSQSVKLAKFTNASAIKEKESLLKAYIFEAIEVEKAGLKVPKPKSTNLEFPDELIEKMSADKAFKTAFENLTPGRQRGYNMFFKAAKQSATRTTRIAKYEDRILKGFGINDCVCGHTKKKPGCDGSHKYL
jgi:uncharacterized protein YdeI (YjbR/CyaY-like superfamily)